ncbi:hypothetical protein BQ8794_240232 [Mesorhizobium prunaredense]|uniref:Uncharacterized protein n=1 Tax=Mesorhizobium prunaredense TaxID=1631249 RepID=A0A1R3V804_9HYPH|nr:hypothetical protein BQ8794_240232 [Mesorhizobium prunaredense]
MRAGADAIKLAIACLITNHPLLAVPRFRSSNAYLAGNFYHSMLSPTHGVRVSAVHVSNAQSSTGLPFRFDGSPKLLIQARMPNTPTSPTTLTNSRSSIANRRCARLRSHD